jgi:hypothetical protein
VEINKFDEDLRTIHICCAYFADNLHDTFGKDEHTIFIVVAKEKQQQIPNEVA